MKTLDRFKLVISAMNPSPSKLTVKNYISDARKFINWFESTHKRDFPPSTLTLDMLQRYLDPIKKTSPRSAKRYSSSLNKFFDFLILEGIIPYNPLSAQKIKHEKIDIWHLRSFANSLYNQKKSPVTIKNYLSDVGQFVLWAESFCFKAEELNPSSAKNIGTQIDPFAKLSSAVIEEYKNRLLNEAGLSPLSVNRKLSSLRQYFVWAGESGLNKHDLNIANEITNIQKETSPETDKAIPVTTEPPGLELLRQISGDQPENDLKALRKEYSRFAPMRLFQKTGKGFELLFDFLFVLSFIKTLEAIKFNLWKATGKEVFAPIPDVIKSLSNAQTPSIGSLVATPVQQPLSALDRFVKMREKDALVRIKGLPKSFYAPQKLSTRALPVWKKILYYFKHTRPNWYKKYHSYSFVHYVHFGIVLLVAVILGLRIYQPFSSPVFDASVLAANTGPERKISFQGRLTDSDGVPISGEKNIRFSIYKSKTASGSALLWEEVQKVNSDASGAFQVSLGKNNPIMQNIFSENPALFLGITIGTNPELSPREELANYTLSNNSQTLQGLKPITGNNAGTENVILALDSSGNLTIGGESNPIFQATGGNFSLRGQELLLSTNPGSEGNIVLSPDGTGIIDIQKAIQNTSEDINPDSTSGSVKIDDTLAVNATSSAQPALQINQNGTGDLVSAKTGDTAKFTVSGSGRVSIGEDLHILGNNLTTVTGTFKIADTTTTHLYIGGAAKEIYLGASQGVTVINHNLDVKEQITAQKGLDLPFLASGSIPFVNSKKQLSKDELNLFWDETNKRLGLGTNTPQNRLSVSDNIALSGSSVASITNASTADSVNNVALRLNLGTGAAGNQARFITFYSDCQGSGCTGTPKGNIAITPSGVAYNSGSADFAEYFKKKDIAENFEEGDIICHSEDKGVEKCTESSNGILGVYSKDAGFVGAGTHEGDPQYVLVGLIGQLKIKISPQAGHIRPGDPIGLDIKSGSATKAMSAGQIVGRALEAYDPMDANRELIKIALNVSWYDPNAVLMNDGRLAAAFENKQKTDESNEDLEDLDKSKNYEYAVQSIQEFINTLNTGLLEIKTISVESIAIATENITIGTESLKQYITRIVNETIDERMSKADSGNENKIVILNPIAQGGESPTPSPAQPISPTPTPDSGATSPDPTPQASPSGALASDTTTYNITNIYNNISTPSAETASLSADITVTPSPVISPTPTVEPTQEPTPIIEKAENVSNVSEVSKAFDTFGTFPSFDTSKNAQIASFSAELQYVPNLTASLGRFDNGLIALGPTSLTDLTVSAQIAIGENMKLSGTSINTIGSDLDLQSLRQGNLKIMGGLVTIDTQGNLNVEGNAVFAKNVSVRGTLAAGIISPLADSDVVVQLGNKNEEENSSSAFVIRDSNGKELAKIDQSGSISASSSGIFANLKLVRGAQADTSFTETIASGSAGTAVITANETERTILTPFVTENSLIYITPASDTLGTTPYIARQTIEESRNGSKGSFTVQISEPQTSDIKLNWIIVN
jgi:site-specific recombinase XerD